MRKTSPIDEVFDWLKKNTHTDREFEEYHGICEVCIQIDQARKELKRKVGVQKQLKRIVDGIQNCGCGAQTGITEKGFSRFKIWKCEKHGFICPFDGWQFKKIEGLEEHFRKQEGFTMDEKDVHCKGVWREGNTAVEEAIFEVNMFKQKLCGGGE